MSDDPRCAKCGHPRSNHPYRHPFVGPSMEDTVKALEAKLAKLVKVLDGEGDRGYCLSPRAKKALAAIKGEAHD